MSFSYWHNDVDRLLNDITHINMLCGVPCAIKMQMVIARVSWFKAHENEDYHEADAAMNQLYELERDWPPMTDSEAAPYTASLRSEIYGQTN
jgi:hypothetical protein